ncbi:MAG: hypothetical protein HY013_14490 [Candidatus Solibacter usitatus]|nr:hypothetical protein [Candidatus Solibacter usitatus]
MKKRLLFRTGAATVVAAALCLAQTAPAPRSRVTITHVKPEMQNEWVDLQKNEVIPALKKAGVKSRRVSSTALFGNAYEYAIVTPLDKFADFDAGNPLTRALGPERSARLQEKLRKCVIGTHSFLSTSMPELSIPRTSQTPPRIVVMTRVRVAAGKAQEWESYVKNEILPVYKKGNVTGYTVSRRSLGANLNDRVLSTSYNSYAELDAGTHLTRLLGAEGAAKVLAKGAGLSTVIETIVRSPVADLSF